MEVTSSGTFPTSQSRHGYNLTLLPIRHPHAADARLSTALSCNDSFANESISDDHSNGLNQKIDIGSTMGETKNEFIKDETETVLRLNVFLIPMTQRKQLQFT